jgi:regulator of RNase E activity RraA
MIVADGDGAVVIPSALAEAVAEEGAAQEKFEAWVLREVERGAPLPGLYPPDQATQARYAAQTKPT